MLVREQAYKIFLFVLTGAYSLIFNPAFILHPQCLFRIKVDEHCVTILNLSYLSIIIPVSTLLTWT